MSWATGSRARLCSIGLLVVLAACELREVGIVEVEDVVVAEVYVDLAEDAAEHRIRAFLHRTEGVPLDVPALEASTVTVRRSDGLAIPLQLVMTRVCVDTAPRSQPGACFESGSGTASVLSSGDRLELDIQLSDGGRISGFTTIPGDFALDEIPGTCRLEENTLLEIRWSRSEGAWAYVNETAIYGLPDALRPEGVFVNEDPLYLLGVSVSDTDTTIVFPSEFGVFNRFELDQELAVRLQTGLPDQTLSEVTITAVDRNYINWARGGNFNPSGPVRIPSVTGDGSGVFASTVNRRFFVDIGFNTTLPLCPE